MASGSIKKTNSSSEKCVSTSIEKKQIGDKHIGLRHTKYEEKNQSASYERRTKKMGGEVIKF